MTKLSYAIASADGQTWPVSDGVLSFEFGAGAQWNPEGGGYSIAAGRGAVVLDQSSDAVRAAIDGGALSAAELIVSHGSTTLARCLLPVIPTEFFPAVDPLNVPLRPRFFSALAAPADYRHVSYADVVASYPSPLEFAADMVEASGRRAGYGLQAGRIVPEGGVAGLLTDIAGSSAAGVQWIYPAVTGLTMAQAWAHIAVWAAAIPWCGLDGKLGMTAYSDAVAAPMAAAPADQVALARHGQEQGTAVTKQTRNAWWGVDVAGSRGVAAGPLETIATVAMTCSDRDSETGEFSAERTMSIPHPKGAADVLYRARPPAPQAFTSVTVTVDPSPRGAADIVTVRATSDTRDATALVSVVGRRVTRHDEKTVPVRSADGGSARLVPTAPWVHFAATVPPDLTAYSSMVGVLNRVTMRGRVVLPLIDGSGRLMPAEQLAVGGSAWFGIAEGTRFGGLITGVRLFDRRGAEPIAVVLCHNLSGVGIVGRAQAGTPATTPPPPVVPHVATTPGRWGHSTWGGGDVWR